MWIVITYLLAIVLANLSVAYWGPISTPFNAFVLVAFDLASRDALHERWERYGKWGLWWRMLCLIGTGGLLSWLLNAGAGRVAIASIIAFVAAGLVDAVVYAGLKARGKGRVIRANGSNVLSAITDSLVFVGVAFGWPIIWWAALGQILAKICGGAVWTYIFVRAGIWKDSTVSL